MRRVVLLLSVCGSVLALACAGGEQTNTGNLSVSVTNITLDEASTEQPADTEDPPTSSTGPVNPTTGASTGPVEDPTTTGDPATTDPATTDPATTAPATTEPATSGPMTTDGGCVCDLAPDACHTAPGECVDDLCVYPPAPADVDCDDGDDCTEADVCDGAGACEGTPVVCDAPNATGSCQAGSCQFVCTAPYDDCDGDMNNGCEVPVGVANQCDSGGLNPNGGCWTAYCGSSNATTATNFDTYYCSDCATCNPLGANSVQWCNHDTGNWYDPGAGGCGAYTKLFCAP